MNYDGLGELRQFVISCFCVFIVVSGCFSV